jgi:hypothetical protein
VSNGSSRSPTMASSVRLTSDLPNRASQRGARRPAWQIPWPGSPPRPIVGHSPRSFHALHRDRTAPTATVPPIASKHDRGGAAPCRLSPVRRDCLDAVAVTKLNASH